MDGLLIVNKDKDYTSRDVVNVVSKVFNTSKVGHTGTLDPLATGVLVIALGNGLKIVDYLTNDTKEYIATVSMGIMTDTLDVTGTVIKQQGDFVCDIDKIKSVLETFRGKSIQEVPYYSAVRVNGKRLYEYARKNEQVDLPKREIEIFDISLLSYNDDEFVFKVSVSKGTYIRALIRDIGLKLDICCTMKELKRTRQGDFLIENSFSLEDIKNGKYRPIPLLEGLKGFEVISVDDFIGNKVKNGRILENRYKSSKIAFIDKEQKVLALYQTYEKDNTKIKPIKVFPTN